MKKLLTILTAGFILTPVVSQIVSCTVDQANVDFSDPMQIGSNIDTSHAQNTSGNYQYGVSNFYTIGDSLSDTNGIGNYMNDRFKQLGFRSDDDNLSITLNGTGYGYEQDNVHYSAFTNGPTAASVIADELGLETFNPSSIYSTVTGEQQYGKNYAVGGATAGKLTGVNGLLLNDATVDLQTAALISQHVIHPNDVVLFEIGGNDLMTMFGLSTPQAIAEFQIDSIARLRTGFFNLLNNGIQNIIFMTPPDLTLIPRYVNASQTEKTRYKTISDTYVTAMKEVLQEVEQYYPNTIHLYDMYKNFTALQTKWLNTFTDEDLRAKAKANLGVAYNDGAATQTSISVNGSTPQVINSEGPLMTYELVYSIIEGIKNQPEGQTGVLDIDITISPQSNHQGDDITTYFFTDVVHPTKEVHKLAAQEALEQFIKPSTRTGEH